ncbi:MAG: long-chain fatty acid--CoA ligase, partial [Chitinophagaceae bacterium]|nr:long-chain fatty acid--CoA ligase [Chitinophagaceae bacterium]
MITRLFDIVQKRAQEQPSSIMLAAKEKGSWRTYSSAETWTMARDLCGGLLSLNLNNSILEPEQQEKIAV